MLSKRLFIFRLFSISQLLFGGYILFLNVLQNAELGLVFRNRTFKWLHPRLRLKTLTINVSFWKSRMMQLIITLPFLDWHYIFLNSDIIIAFRCTIVCDLLVPKVFFYKWTYTRWFNKEKKMAHNLLIRLAEVLLFIKTALSNRMTVNLSRFLLMKANPQNAPCVMNDDQRWEFDIGQLKLSFRSLWESLTDGRLYVYKHILQYVWDWTK